MDDWSSADPAPAHRARQQQIRAAATAELAKHHRLLRTGRDGRILSAAMLPWFRLRPPPGYGILTTTGRKSGIKRRKCVRVIRRDNRAYLVQLQPPNAAIERPGAASSWLLNIRADPHVELRIRGGNHTGTAREITDPDELRLARTTLCETVHRTDYGECALHLRGRPTRAKIQELHRYWFGTGTAIAIDLDERPAP
ncbi:nitroreductase/quinone reductase family protein [Nocardia sp. NPDC057440]|uniref:nitroreductase/quinone reductase family protein n=1 Tax=Nocardia sp. NPDC057440 TaxID=3346134 RepID=UPI00367294B7